MVRFYMYLELGLVLSVHVVYPPGPAWLFVIVDGVPSEAVKVMVGEGRSPPVDQGAIEK
jgi:hypothetical protein